MTALLITALTLLVVLLGRTIHRDGLGHRPPPASHVPWDSPPLDGSGWG
jgi:hypothetical protein